jgi:hypothetical protein
MTFTSSIFFDFPLLCGPELQVLLQVTTQKAYPDLGLSVDSFHGSNRLNIDQVGLIRPFLSVPFMFISSDG